MNRIFDANEVLRIGLLCAGFDANRHIRVADETNVRHFQSHYGSSPLVCSMIWKDLVTAPGQVLPKADVSGCWHPDVPRSATAKSNAH